MPPGVTFGRKRVAAVERRSEVEVVALVLVGAAVVPDDADGTAVVHGERRVGVVARSLVVVDRDGLRPGLAAVGGVHDADVVPISGVVEPHHVDPAAERPVGQIDRGVAVALRLLGAESVTRQPERRDARGDRVALSPVVRGRDPQRHRIIRQGLDLLVRIPERPVGHDALRHGQERQDDLPVRRHDHVHEGEDPLVGSAREEIGLPERLSPVVREGDGERRPGLAVETQRLDGRARVDPAGVAARAVESHVLPVESLGAEKQCRVTPGPALVARAGDPEPGAVVGAIERISLPVEVCDRVPSRRDLRRALRQDDARPAESAVPADVAGRSHLSLRDAADGREHVLRIHRIDGEKGLAVGIRRRVGRDRDGLADLDLLRGRRRREQRDRRRSERRPTAVAHRSIPHRAAGFGEPPEGAMYFSNQCTMRSVASTALTSDQSPGTWPSPS